jgi:hypothetical protein
LRELLLISQDRYDVELHSRQPDGAWVLIDADGLDAFIALESIDYNLSLRDLYEKVLRSQRA